MKSDVWTADHKICIFATNQIVADPTYEEEQLATGFINVVWDTSSKELINVSKDGGTAITESNFETMFTQSQKRANETIALIKQGK